MAAKVWHRAPDPRSLDDYPWQDDRISERKRFLFMAAVGRHIRPLMREPKCVRVVEACEELAEGVIDEETWWGVTEAGHGAAEWAKVPAIGTATKDFVRLLGDDSKHDRCVDCAEDALGYVAATEAGVLKPSATWRRGVTQMRLSD